MLNVYLLLFEPSVTRQKYVIVMRFIRDPLKKLKKI